MALRAFTKVLLMAAVAAVISNSMPAAIAADSPAPTAGPTCDDAINSLVACYSFVTGGEPLPSEECCAGFATVRTAQPVCLCQLVGNSGGGGDTGINVTLALELPNVCNVTAVDATTCAGATSPALPPVVPGPSQNSEPGAGTPASPPSGPSAPQSPGREAPASNSSTSVPGNSSSGSPANSAPSSRTVSGASMVRCAIAGCGALAIFSVLG